MSEEAHNTAVTQPQTVQTTEQATAPTKTAEPVKPQTVQPTSTVKTPDQVKPQTVQTTKTVTDPKQAPAPVKPEPVKPQPTQTTEQATSAKQPAAPVKATESVKSQPTDNTVSTVLAPAKTPAPVAPQTTGVPKLSDIIPTSKVWISGLIGDRQIDCLGPIEIPLKIDEPTYPFTPVPSNSDYTNQVFDYDTSTWVPTDAKSQGQQLTDLTKEVADLQQTITKHEKDAETSQAISLQQMQMLMSITAKLDALTKKEGVK